MNDPSPSATPGAPEAPPGGRADLPEHGGIGGLLFHRLSSALNLLGSAWILAVMVLINVDVFSRALFNDPVAGVPEMVQLSIVGIVFLQITHTLRMRRFIRSDVLIGRLLARGTAPGILLQAFHHLVGAVLLGIIFYFTINRFLRAYRIDEYVGTEGDFTAPVWPIYLIILIGCGGTLLQFLFHFVADVTAVSKRASASAGSGR